MNRIIAIDGPAASGKSTVARRLAERLGCLYVDSGALYRAVTWTVIGEKVDPADAAAVAEAASRMDLRFFVAERRVWFAVGGRALDAELRTEAVNRLVSPVAAVPAVRQRVVAWLRSTAALGDLVMEGRDIGTAVFPGTPHKFYLDAAPAERARRRHREMDGDGRGADVDRVAESLARRDLIDSSRRADPLRVAAGARVVDTTAMSVDQVVDAILAAVRGGGPPAPP